MQRLSLHRALGSRCPDLPLQCRNDGSETISPDRVGEGRGL